MNADQLRELADDIDKNDRDLWEPVDLYRDPKLPDLGDSLIDGRNRLSALELLGEEIFLYPGKRKAIRPGASNQIPQPPLPTEGIRPPAAASPFARNVPRWPVR